MRGLVNLWFSLSFYSFLSWFLKLNFYFLFLKLLLHTTDVCRHKILVALVFIMAMHSVIAQVVALEQMAIGQHWNMMSAICCFPWSLLTWHQEFTTCGNTRRQWNT